MMVTKKAFEVLLYISLSVGAILFVKQTIEEFLEGSTMYTTSQEPLRLYDLPTITICWKLWSSRLIYGKDFIIDIKIIEMDEETLTLLEDNYVHTSNGLGMHLGRLFFGHFEKKLKAKKTQADKRLKQIFPKNSSK